MQTSITFKDIQAIDRRVKKFEHLHAIKGNSLLKQLTQDEYKALRRNYDMNEKKQEQYQDTWEFGAVAKFFDPQGGASWFVSELSPDNMGYGLCHILDSEIGYMDFDEMARFRGRFGLPIEKDRYFKNVGKSLKELLQMPNYMR